MSEDRHEQWKRFKSETPATARLVEAIREGEISVDRTNSLVFPHAGLSESKIKQLVADIAESNKECCDV
jgi:hypothetical protein